MSGRNNSSLENQKKRGKKLIDRGKKHGQVYVSVKGEIYGRSDISSIETIASTCRTNSHFHALRIEKNRSPPKESGGSNFEARISFGNQVRKQNSNRFPHQTPDPEMRASNSAYPPFLSAIFLAPSTTLMSLTVKVPKCPQNLKVALQAHMNDLNV